MNAEDYKNHLIAQKQKLQAQVGRMVAAITKKDLDLQKKEMTLAQGGGPGELARKMSQMPIYLAPGNVGDVNKVIWPSFFPTEVVRLAPNQQVDTGFSVSKTAAFIMVAYIKAIYLEEDLGGGNFSYTYIDPDDPAGSGDAPDLSFAFRNSSSTREHMDTTVNLDHVGNPRWPTFLYAPQMVFPNQNIEVSFFNDHPTNIYRASLTFYGIRIRIDESYDLLSSVFGE